MSDGVAFKIALDVTASSEAIVTEFAAKHLRERGYYVVAPGAAWEKPGAFCKRIGIYPHRLRDLIVRYGLRGGAPIRIDERGKSGRINSLQSNPQFDEFCRSMRGARKKE